MNEKISTAATYGGSGVAVYFGFSPGEWQVIGIVGGIVIGVVGLAVNVYFQHRRLQIELARSGE